MLKRVLMKLNETLETNVKWFRSSSSR